MELQDIWHSILHNRLLAHIQSSCCFCVIVIAHALQAIDLKDCDVYSYKSDGETDPFGEQLC